MPASPPRRASSEFDLEMARIQARNTRYALNVGILRLLIVSGTILGSIWLIFEGIRPILARDAPAIEAFASVVKALSLDRIVMALVSLVAGVAWWLERSGKKRALREKAALQRQIEGADAYRSSSGNPI